MQKYILNNVDNQTAFQTPLTFIVWKETILLPTFFKISYFEFNRTKTHTGFNIMVSK